jgi:hypothetical protein
VMKIRFGPKSAGHWVTFTLKFQDYCLCMELSTCESSKPYEKGTHHTLKRVFGNAACKEIPCTIIAHELYDYLPLIDEHNKQQRGIL